MSASDLNISLVLKLVDRISGPAKGAVAALGRIGKASENVGGAGVARARALEQSSRNRALAARGELMGVMAVGAGLMALTEPAIQAERRMAEISKVVSFDGPNGISKLQKDIRELVTGGGLATTASGVADIVAAAGRMGMVDENLPDDEKRRKLLEFASAASKMSVAFGISAELAGTSLARWQKNLGLSSDQAMLLGDTINFLGNTMATNEGDILSVVNRMGVVAKTSGLAARQTAALSASFLAAGSSPEIAATGMKNFLNALTKGAAATDRQKAVFEALGIDSVEMAKRMQVDATGGIMAVIEALQKMEPYRRNSLVGDLFGEEGKMAIMSLIENGEQLRATFAATADTAAMLGLVEEEYQRQAATTFAQRQRLLEYVKGLSVVIGSTLLPAMNDLFASIMPVVNQITNWVEANPELVALILKITAGLIGFKFASAAVRFALFSLLGPFFRLFRVGSGVLKILPKIVRALGGIKPLKWATLIPKLIWKGRISPINWVRLALMLSWRKLVRPLVWSARWVPKIPWLMLGKMLSWAKLVRPLKWTSRFIPALKWGSMAARLGVLGMTAGGWGKLVTPLKWFGRGALKLIPGIGWAMMAAEIGLFAWNTLGLKELPWRDYLKKTIEWKDWFFSFEWLDFLPSWDWENIIPKFDLAGRLGWGDVPKPDNSVATATGFDQLPQSTREAALTVEAIGASGEAPTSAYFEELTTYAAELRGEIAKIQGDVERLGDGPLATVSAEPKIAEMKRLQGELAEIEAEQARVKAQSGELAKALQVVSDLEVTPVINSDSIKTALDRVRALSVATQGLVGGRTSAQTSPRTPPGRDRGGPVRAGMPYIVGERHPELFMPGVSGSIMPARLMKAAMTAGAVAMPTAALPSPAEIMARVDTRPPVSTQSTAPVINRGGDTYIINITPSAGSDAAEIAREVERQLRRRQNARRGDLHDGVDF